jgi:YggT family protein
VLLVCFALSLYTWILFIRIILSWVQMTAWRPPLALAPLLDLIYRVTDPVLDLFRRYIPPVGGLDLSPIFIFLILSFLKSGLGCPPLLGLF